MCNIAIDTMQPNVCLVTELETLSAGRKSFLNLHYLP